ncbi:hypothetical protein EAF00_008793 [Botryotinia globosa]|nr:hypothetical protein EAF00_008793 [Botryotinia globosa]
MPANNHPRGYTSIRSGPDRTETYDCREYMVRIIPYLAMTLVNLISNMVSPDYSCFYMIRSETMVEAENMGGRFEGEIAQMITFLPEDGMQVENPAWSGLTKEDIRNSSVKLHATATRMHIFSTVIYFFDLIIAGKAKKKLSAKDAKMIHLEVISQLDAGTIPSANKSETSAMQANQPVNPADTTLLPVVQNDFIVDQFRTQSNPDILAKSVGSANEYQIQIPRAPRLLPGKSLFHTIHRVLENLSSARGQKKSTFFAMLQNMKENRMRLKCYKLPDSYIKREPCFCTILR